MSADNKKVVSNENLAAFAEALAAKVPLKSDIPTKVSDLQNDLGFTDKQGTITSVTLNGTTTSSGGVDLGYLVVQEGGKGLSSNDYTALEKNKLGGIDTGAQVNTIETVKVNGTALTPDANKAVDVQVPTTVAELSDSSDYAKTSDLEDYVLISDLEDTEEVLAAAVNDLNDRIAGLVDQYPTEGSENAVSSGGVYEVITENEQIISSSLSSLDSRITDLEEAAESAPGLDQVPIENSTNAVSSGGVYNVITQNELISATAINELNTRVSDVEDGLDNIVIPTKVSDLQNDSGFTSNTGTITGVTMNGASKGTSGVVDLGTIVVSESDPVFSASVASGITSSDISNWNGKQNALTFDSVPTENSTNPVTSGGLYSVIIENEEATAGAINLLNGRVSDLENAPVFTESDPVFSASAASGITASDITNWNSKTSNTGTLTGVSFNGVDASVTNGVASITATIPAAVTESTVSGWGFTKNTGTLTGVSFNGSSATVSNGVASISASIPDVANYFDEVAYDSQTKRINFKHGETVMKYIDATDFIKDGMVDSVEIATPESGNNAGVSCLVVTFNTDAGKEDIEIPLSSIFNPTNYYTKTETDSTFVKKADIDSVPTENSNNPVSSGGVYNTIAQSEYVISTSLNDLNTRVSGIESDLYEGSGYLSLSGGEMDPDAYISFSSEDEGYYSQLSYSQLSFTAPSENNGISYYTSYGLNHIGWDDETGSSYNLSFPKNSGTLALTSDISSLPAAGITASDITGWNNKVSNVQSDWNATTGLGVILNKPTIPAAVTESTVSGWGFTKNTGTYSKPSGGIPASDLTTAVQTSLGKADTALQSFTETDPVFSASAAAGITSSDITNWNSKTSNIGNAKIFYGTCSTAGATAAKIVDCSIFTSADLVNGALVFVTFSETNSATPATLTMDVNSTGAKSIKKQYKAASVTSLTAGGELRDNVTYLFTYNGSSWVCMTLDYNSTYSTIDAQSAIAGTGTVAGLVSPDVLKTAITTHAPAAITESDVAGWGFTKNAGTLTSESDPVFSASVASSITAADISNWNSKTSNTGTLTGVKFNNVDATVSNGVASISATIPAAVTESTVSGWGFTKNTGTLTGVKVNGSNATVTSGVADIGTVITSETQLSKGTTSGSGNAVTDISVSNHQITLTKGSTFLTSHQSIKTINNQTITGTGNLTLDTLPTVSASDNGKILMVVNGAWTLVSPVTIYSGSGEPNNSMGNNGDIYLQT